MTGTALIFFQAAALGLTAAGSPGAFQAFLINQSLSGGWRRGALVTLGPLLSDPPIVLAILFLLDKLPPGFLRWIGLLGGMFALYLAWGLWRAALQAPDDHTAALKDQASRDEKISARRIVSQAALMNLLSPGPYLFWSLVLGPLLLNAWKSSPAGGLAFLAGFYGAFIGGMLAMAALFAQAQRLGPRAAHLLARLSVLILALFGLFLIWQAVGI